MQQNLKDHGVVVLSEPIPYIMRERLMSEGRMVSDKLAMPFGRYHPTENGWRVNVTPVRVTRENGWPWFAGALDFLEWIKPHANAHLGKGWGVNQLIWDYSKKTTGDLFPPHVDNFECRRALKAYVYLTGTGQLNGALQYSTASHHIGHAHMAEIGTGDNSLARLEKLHKWPIERPTHINGEPGTVILFDPAGVHGSGPVHHGVRYIFRAHLVEAAYVRRYLPDQLPWYQRPLARVLRKVRP